MASCSSYGEMVLNGELSWGEHGVLSGRVYMESAEQQMMIGILLHPAC